MGPDDFQLFDQRRKRKALGDITNHSHRPSLKSQFSLKPTALSGREHGKHHIFGRASIGRQRELQQIDKITSHRGIFLAKKIKVLNSKADGTGLDTDASKSNHLLLLNLKNVVSETKFANKSPTLRLHFEFVHSLVDYNVISRESNRCIKEFANRQKLNHIQSLRHTVEKNSLKEGEKDSTQIKVIKSTPMSAFITVVSSTELEDCLLLNTTGKQTLAGKTLVLHTFRNYNLLGKDYRLYTEWDVKA